MPTQAEITEYDQSVIDLQTLAVAALVADWPGAVIPNVQALVLQLTEDYASALAAVATDFYTSVRPGGSPSFEPTPQVREDLLGYGTRSWMVEPLEDDLPDEAMKRSAGALMKAVKTAGIETIGNATAEDPLEVRYCRFPQNDDPCAWCVLRASRGAIFWSESSAENGDHLKCQCRITPVFAGDPLPYLRKPYYAQYEAGAAEADGTGRKALLSGMRRANGTR